MDHQRQKKTDKELDTLCSMFGAIQRDVVRAVFIEQCGGDMDEAVKALTMMNPLEAERASKSRNELNTVEDEKTLDDRGDGQDEATDGT